jgi:hypothetical protein
VTGLPVGKAELDVQSTLAQAIHHLLSDDEQQRLEVRIACIPSCDERKTSSALVEFKGGDPRFLAQLDRDPLGDWQIEMGGEDINFDRHFFGFTQLYPALPSFTIRLQESLSLPSTIPLLKLACIALIQDRVVSLPSLA